jgi:hypothetical protein
MESGLDSDEVYSYLKLSVDPARLEDDEIKVTITGSFRWWEKIGTFRALVRDEKETANYWDMDLVEWAEVPEDDIQPMYEERGDDRLEKRQRFGHGITVLKTLDDKGHPFVELIYNIGPNDTGSQTMKASGKRQEDDKGRFGLTSQEAERLMKDGAA